MNQMKHYPFLGDFRLLDGPPNVGDLLDQEYYEKQVKLVCKYDSDTMRAEVLQDIHVGFVIVVIAWVFGDDENDADLRTVNARKVRKVFALDTSSETILHAMGWLLDIDRGLSNLHYATDL